MNWISLSLGAVSAFVISWAAHSIDVSHLEKKQAKGLAEQHDSLVNQCNDEKAKMEAINNDQESRLKTLDGKYRVISKRVQDSPSCVPIIK